ncbi:MAG: SDR family NAD(P)-dependent oxidoreductase [Candidatus Pacebacteria bacterium]|nr:SDR family NAD(P)-dependent oxidoreductase [Candidatus Paceibacterota bacterium]
MNLDNAPVILITGASRGIGAEVAVALASLGHQLVLVARDKGGLEAVDDRIAAAGSKATLVPLDLKHGDDIDRMVEGIFNRFGRLDGLVGNAASLGGGLYPVGHIPYDRLAEIVAVNLAANWRLIRACEPLLRAAPAGRAVFTTCVEAGGVRPFYGAYAASKAGLEALVRAWAGEVEKTSLRVNMVDPGPVATELRALAFPGEDRSQLPKPAQVVPLFLDLLSGDCRRHGQVLRFG